MTTRKISVGFLFSLGCMPICERNQWRLDFYYIDGYRASIGPLRFGVRKIVVYR